MCGALSPTNNQTSKKINMYSVEKEFSFALKYRRLYFFLQTKDQKEQCSAFGFTNILSSCCNHYVSFGHSVEKRIL